MSKTRRPTASKANKCTAKSDDIIKEFLGLGWFPETISQRLKVETEVHEQLSHSMIYRRIEEDWQLGGKLHRKHPRFGKIRWKGGKRYRQAGVRLIPDSVDITNRPKVVDARDRLGDWEGDTVHGRNAHPVTLVDRRCLFTLVERVLRKTKELVADAMIKMLKKVKSVLTITLDNGGEFADHVRVAKATGADVYFTKPYASWQRGTNENTNGRIRRLWPKNIDMATLTDQEIVDRIFLLNLTPRKVLAGVLHLLLESSRPIARLP